jgi:hypothetical protein
MENDGPKQPKPDETTEPPTTGSKPAEKSCITNVTHLHGGKAWQIIGVSGKRA